MEKVDFLPPASYLAERFGVHITTARRWVREHYAPPAIAMILARDLGCLDPLWAGWTVRNGLLRSPEGILLSIHEALSYPFMRVQISALQDDIKQMREARESGIEEQPQPCEWDLERLIG